MNKEKATIAFEAVFISDLPVGNCGYKVTRVAQSAADGNFYGHLQGCVWGKIKAFCRGNGMMLKRGVS